MHRLMTKSKPGRSTNDSIQTNSPQSNPLIWLRHDPRLNFNAPIVYCHYKKAYYYTDPEYSIFKVNVTRELEQSVALTQLLTQQCGENHILKIAEPMLHAVSRLIHVAMPVCDSKFPFIRFQTRSPGFNFFAPIAEAIRSSKVLLLQLGTFVNKRRQHTFHPYILKEVNHEWFVIGYTEKLKRLASIRLSILKSVDEIDFPFFKEGRRMIGEGVDWDVFDCMVC